jgi:flavin reductase (DIM6/NTAB) family NADH-FMN oxidoreductase RutF
MLGSLQRVAGAEKLALHFAGRTDKANDDSLREVDGLLVLGQACAVYTAHVDHAVDAGDHVIFVGRVSFLLHNADATPLLFHKGRFGTLESEALPAALILEESFWY